MKSLLVLVGVLAALQLAAATASYYTPAFQCASGPTVQHEDVTLLMTGVEVSTVYTTVDQVHLNTVLVVQPVPGGDLAELAASFTSIPEDLFVTEVELVQETLPLTITQVSTVTTTIVLTEVEVYTSSATNYMTEFETLAAPSTSHSTVTITGTLFSELTVTAQTTLLTTLTVTNASLLTDVVTESVPQTIFVATDTAVHTETSTNVHSLTKMVTQFVCPPGLE